MSGHAGLSFDESSALRADTERLEAADSFKRKLRTTDPLEMGTNLGAGDGYLEDEETLAYLAQVEEDWKRRKRQRETSKVCVSGGAKGADSLWCSAAHRAGFEVRIMSFENHSVVVPDVAARVITLEVGALKEANAMLARASRSIKRKLPSPSSYNLKLLQRNWWIVKDVDAVVAIGKLDPNGHGLGVEGGTAWGCEMFWLAQNSPLRSSAVPLFLFDMVSAKWYQVTREGKWKSCSTPSLEPYTTVAMIGSRELSDSASNSIQDVFRVVK